MHERARVCAFTVHFFFFFKLAFMRAPGPLNGGLEMSELCQGFQRCETAGPPHTQSHNPPQKV